MSSKGDALIEAASKGQLDTIKALLQPHNETSTQKADISIDRLASEAARHRHPDVLQYCLDQGEETPKYTSRHTTLLLLILTRPPGPSSELYACIIYQESKANKTNIYITGANAKSHTVYTGVLDSASLEIYKIVIPHGFDPNYDPDNLVGGPLIWAVSSNNIPLTTYLLEHGAANPNADLQTMRYRPLAKAVLANNVEMIELLIRHGAHVNESGALLLAAEKGYVETVRCLIRHKEGDDGGGGGGRGIVDLDLHRWRETMLYMGPQDEETALHKAVKGGHEGVVKLLVESGADGTLTDMNGQTALEIARGIEGGGTMVQILENGQSARK